MIFFVNTKLQGKFLMKFQFDQYSDTKYWNCYNFAKRNRKCINNKLGLASKILKPSSSKYVIHFILKRFYITWQVGKWRYFSSRKCYKLSEYVKAMKIFFIIEFTMDLKIEASSLQEFPKDWCMTFVSSFHWTYA